MNPWPTNTEQIRRVVEIHMRGAQPKFRRTFDWSWVTALLGALAVIAFFYVIGGMA